MVNGGKTVLFGNHQLVNLLILLHGKVNGNRIEFLIAIIEKARKQRITVIKRSSRFNFFFSKHFSPFRIFQLNAVRSFGHIRVTFEIVSIMLKRSKCLFERQTEMLFYSTEKEMDSSRKN